jgi:hypothetical protein
MIVKYFLRNLYSCFSGLINSFRIYFLQNKYKSHSYDREFDWKWSKYNINRIALINLLISKKNDCSYLEIGCASNNLFDSVYIPDKTGVDPFKGGNVRKTSNDFFNNNKKLYDIIFIDGLHIYQQVRQDVINSIKFLKPNGWIVLHDMLPRNWIEHHVPNLSPGVWTGDVWKLGFELSLTKDIDFKIIKIDHGVGVFKLNKNNVTLFDLSKILNTAQFSYFYKNIRKLPIIDWNNFKKWLNKIN